MRSRVWQGMLCTLVLVAGCGGDEKPEKRTADAPPKQAIPGAPRASESAKDAAARFADADCAGRDELFLASDKIPAELCPKILPSLEPASADAIDVYGSGAIMRNAQGGQTVLALDTSGRLKFVTTFRAPFGEGTDAGAESTANEVVTSLRNDDCESLVAVSLTYEQAEGEKFCALGPVRSLRAAVGGDPRAQPKLFGGDGSFAFAGIATTRGYFTLVLAAGESGDYLFVTAAEA